MRRKEELPIERQLPRGPMDLPFLLLAMLLLAIGLIVMLSASSASAYYETGNPTEYFIGQAFLGGVGVLIMFLISHINYQTFRGLSVLALVFAFVLLLLVFTPLGSASGGSRRWLILFGLRFQPSELMKVAIILYFAASLSKMRDKIQSLRGIAPFATILLAVAVMLRFQPHLSAMILMFAIGAVLLFAAGARLQWFVAGGLVAVTGIFFIITSTDYMSGRIAIWKDPWIDPQGLGFQSIQSLYAIGSGGLLGLGLGRSRQKNLFLPEEHNDYIFSIACEELGYIGAMIILLLFSLLIIRGYWLALHARDRFGSLLIVGVTTQIAVQTFLNIGVVTGLLPPTGISLPFFSYGGTALMIQLAEVGMVLSVSRQIPAARSG